MTGESKTEHDAHQTGGYRRKTGSTGNTHIDTQTDGTQGTEEGERERGTRETRHTHIQRHDWANRELDKHEDNTDLTG